MNWLERGAEALGKKLGLHAEGERRLLALVAEEQRRFQALMAERVARGELLYDAEGQAWYLPGDLVRWPRPTGLWRAPTEAELMPLSAMPTRETWPDAPGEAR